MPDPAKITTRTTPEGISVEIRHADRRFDDEVLIDGERVEVIRVNVYRDGGTMCYTTDRGVLTLPRRLGNPDRRPRWKPEGTNA